MIANFFGLRDEKKKTFSQKLFFRVFTTGFRASREMFWGKKICLSKKFYFFVIIFGVWVISLFFFQNSLVRCVKPPINVLREIKWGNYPGKSVFSINFEFWGKKTWFFSKIVSHNSQNRSLRVQMNFFRSFSGSKKICMKVFGHWTETSDFPRKCILRVVKGASQVFSATFWKKDDKSKLYFLWLV